MILLSIIIPCYNTARFIGLCIESLKKQPYDSLEFIFVNDGSTDNTLDLVRSFAIMDKRVVVIDKPNEGVSSARNEALRIAKGDYVFLLDSDDYLTDNAAEIIYRVIQKDNFDVLVSNINILKSIGNVFSYNHRIPVGCYSPHELYKKCRSFPIPPQLVYRKEIIDKNNLFFDPAVHAGEVYLFTVQFMQYASRVSVISDSFYNYVQHEGSAVHMPNYSKDITAVSAINKIYDYGKEFTGTGSFNATAFATTASLSYVKYVRCRILDKGAEDVIRSVLDNKCFNRALIKTAFGFHRNPKKRLLALYIFVTRLWGYRILVRLERFRKL